VRIFGDVFVCCGTCVCKLPGKVFLMRGIKNVQIVHTPQEYRKRGGNVPLVTSMRVNECFKIGPHLSSEEICPECIR
jgi:hypothetical protein